MTESKLFRSGYKRSFKGASKLLSIVNSTIKAIATNGTEKLSMEMIGMNAGYSSSYASVYFSSKDIYFEFIADYAVRQVFEEIRAKPYPKPGKESIERLIAVYSSANQNTENLIKCIYMLHNYSLKECASIKVILEKYNQSIKEYISNNLEVMGSNAVAENYSELADYVFMALSGSSVEMIFNDSNGNLEIEHKLRKLIFGKILMNLLYSKSYSYRLHQLSSVARRCIKN